MLGEYQFPRKLLGLVRGETETPELPLVKLISVEPFYSFSRERCLKLVQRIRYGTETAVLGVAARVVACGGHLCSFLKSRVSQTAAAGAERVVRSSPLRDSMQKRFVIQGRLTSTSTGRALEAQLAYPLGIRFREDQLS